VGKTDLGTDQLPAPNRPLIAGDLGFHHHSEAHVISASDWKACTFTDRHFKP